MKLGVLSVVFGDKSLEETLDVVAESGLQTIELGCGYYPGKSHCQPETLLADQQKLKALRDAVASRGLEISALSCHGNPLHPDEAIASESHADFENAVRLAEELGVQNVITFSGCPGESDDSHNPVWVTCAWPPEHAEVLEWQWQEKVIPYWAAQHEFLKSHGVRVGIEAHPGFVVYNTDTCLRLRSTCGDTIGVNFDPSHLFWQQMDPVVCIKELAKAGALYHVHAKDTALDSENTARNGVLDTKPYTDELNRSWIFRTIGYGHGEETWRRIISALQVVGYDGAISIEHEDSLMSGEEGFYKAVNFLQKEIIRERAGEIWWA